MNGTRLGRTQEIHVNTYSYLVIHVKIQPDIRILLNPGFLLANECFIFSITSLHRKKTELDGRYRVRIGILRIEVKK